MLEVRIKVLDLVPESEWRVREAVRILGASQPDWGRTVVLSNENTVEAWLRAELVAVGVVEGLEFRHVTEAELDTPERDGVLIEVLGHRLHVQTGGHGSRVVVEHPDVTDPVSGGDADEVMREFFDTP